MATNVTQRGVTFAFSADKTVGQYCNGDWWVVGPVTITSITPASAVTSGTFNGGVATYSNRVTNGTQVNPGNRLDTSAGTTADNDFGADGDQGFDGLPSAVISGTTLSNPAPYRASLNVDPGKTGTSLTVSEGSVVKTISDATPATTGRASISDMVVLTVVTSAPAAGSFRPAPALASKASPFTEAMLDYGVLPNFAVPGSAPSLATVADYVARPYQVGLTNNTASRNISPSNNHPEYGRDRAVLLGDVALRLCCTATSAAKRDAMVGMVQLGLDVCGRVSEGGIFYDLGGGDQGFKFPAILAALALNNAGLKTLAGQAKTFSDDRQCFYVSQDDVDLARYTADGRTRDAYTVGMIGTPEWGEQHMRQPNRDGSNLDAFYRDIVFSSAFPGVLAGRYLTGGKALWNDAATMDYYERGYGLFGGSFGSTNQINAFAHDMRAANGADLASGGLTFAGGAMTFAGTWTPTVGKTMTLTAGSMAMSGTWTARAGALGFSGGQMAHSGTWTLAAAQPLPSAFTGARRYKCTAIRRILKLKVST